MRKQLNFSIFLILFTLLFTGCQKKINYDNTQIRHNGLLYEINKNATFSGVVLEHHPNKQIFISATYKNGKLNGKYEQFDSSGNRILGTVFQDNFPTTGVITGISLLTREEAIQTYFKFENNFRAGIFSELINRNNGSLLGFKSIDPLYRVIHLNKENRNLTYLDSSKDKEKPFKNLSRNILNQLKKLESKFNQWFLATFSTIICNYGVIKYSKIKNV